MQPTLYSSRLVLRPYAIDDAKRVQELAGDARIADTTLTIPNPYPDGAAEEWISGLAVAFDSKKQITYAVVLERTKELLGTVSLIDIQSRHDRAELGYWTGVPYWGKGYCTEAVCRLIRFANEHLGTTRIVARCLARNLGSARVMVKAGLAQEGLMRQHILKSGVYEDMLIYGLILPGQNEA